ncbi:ATP-dependent Clp protease proteolytic subunit 5, chloroplastic, partial [Cucurbita argyrosperma subsp. sororia]
MSDLSGSVSVKAKGLEASDGDINRGHCHRITCSTHFLLHLYLRRRSLLPSDKASRTLLRILGRLNSLVSVPNSSSSSESQKLFLPLENFHSRKLGKLVGGGRNLKNSPVKAIYSGEFSSLDKSSRQGLWSIRDDVQIPSSPYFPTYAQGQGPPPMVQERFQSVISQLFQHRIVRCGGAVDDDMANIIVAQLLYLDAVDPNKDIILYVNSPGGSVTAGMAIFDTMRHIRPDVSTVCVGLAASMGAFLLSAGTKGTSF